MAKNENKTGTTYECEMKYEVYQHQKQTIEYLNYRVKLNEIIRP